MKSRKINSVTYNYDTIRQAFFLGTFLASLPLILIAYTITQHINKKANHKILNQPRHIVVCILLSYQVRIFSRKLLTFL